MAHDDPPERSLNMGGALNRVVRIVGHDREVRAVVEDDFHHFRVALSHDGHKVTRISSESPRSPYSLCPAAGLRLQLLVGTALTDDPTATARLLDARQQCTHQFDLAGLALAAAARGTKELRYDLAVSDAVHGKQHAVLHRNGVQVLDWDVADYAIVAPPAFAGRGLGAGFTTWVAQALENQAAEDALVLRRGVFISDGRGLADWLDGLDHAPATGGCWVQQPEQNEQAKRHRGSTLDFAGRTDELTRDDNAWLERL